MQFSTASGYVRLTNISKSLEDCSWLPYNGPRKLYLENLLQEATLDGFRWLVSLASLGRDRLRPIAQRDRLDHGEASGLSLVLPSGQQLPFSARAHAAAEHRADLGAGEGHAHVHGLAAGR